MLSVALCHSGLYVATGHQDGTVHVWDYATLSAVQRLKCHLYRVLSVAWSPDSKRIVSGSGDTTVCVWNMDLDRKMATLEGNRNAVSSVTFSPDGLRIVSGALDNTVRIWDAITFQALHTFEHESYVRCVAVSPCSSMIIASGDFYKSRVWNSATGVALPKFEWASLQVYCISFSPCGQNVAMGHDRTVGVYRFKLGRRLRELEGHTDQVTSVAYSPNDRGARIVSSSLDNTIRVWNYKKGTCLFTVHEYAKGVFAAVFSPDGSTIVSASLNYTMRKWNCKTGEAPQVAYTLDIDIPIVAQRYKDGSEKDSMVLLNTPLQDHHVAAIADALVAPSCSLKKLHMVDCNVSDHAVVTLAEALKVNTSLQDFELRVNYNKKRCITALADAININYTLTSLYVDGPIHVKEQIHAALEANRDPVKRAEKKLAFELRLQREGFVPVAKVARIMA